MTSVVMVVVKVAKVFTFFRLFLFIRVRERLSCSQLFIPFYRVTVSMLSFWSLSLWSNWPHFLKLTSGLFCIDLVLEDAIRASEGLSHKDYRVKCPVLSWNEPARSAHLWMIILNAVGGFWAPVTGPSPIPLWCSSGIAAIRKWLTIIKVIAIFQRTQLSLFSVAPLPFILSISILKYAAPSMYCGYFLSCNSSKSSSPQLWTSEDWF